LSRVIGQAIRPANGLSHSARHVALISSIVLCAALFGILTRPLGFLAAFWPANAILLGLLVRNPQLATVWVWLGAFAAYMAADLLTGSKLAITFWLTGANLVGVAAGCLAFRWMPAEDRRFLRPQSVLYVFGASLIAASASAIVGSGAASIVFNRDATTGLGFWFSTELANTIIVLPILLAAPKADQMRATVLSWFNTNGDYRNRLAPVTTLVLCMVCSTLVGGPGAFAYPLPALLWCALRYSLFTTTLMTLVFSVWGMIVFTGDQTLVPVKVDHFDWDISIRLAIALNALGPLAVASVIAVRNNLLAQLRHAVDHDSLTSALARATFLQRCSYLVGKSMKMQHTAVLMLDIDHFKSVNDRFGHSAGDKALVAFSSAVAGVLRSKDLFGRMGGEEFAVLLPDINHREGQAIAERIRLAVERTVIDLGDDRQLKITVSGGLSIVPGGSSRLIETALAAADTALYKAKTEGRNRIVTAA
jgi:diguanylate cyclase (GGDEF)-like protein